MITEIATIDSRCHLSSGTAKNCAVCLGLKTRFSWVNDNREHDWWGELGGGMTTLHTITNYLYSEKNTDLLKSLNRSNREDIKSFDE